MDLRVKKTRSAIINAFLDLRVNTPLERITIRQLCTRAQINKSTFYLHFKDIFDLSETLECEVIDSILTSIPNPEYLITSPREGVEQIYTSVCSHMSMTRILFSGNRQPMMLELLEPKIKELIFEKKPELRNQIHADIAISVLVHGIFYVFLQNLHTTKAEDLIEIFGRISESVVQGFRSS